MKCVVNDTDAVFFPGAIQHRDVKVAGVSYEDDYRGNALAATVSPRKIDIRFHKAYDDTRVQRIFSQILASPEVALLARYTVRYQGRTVIAGS